MIYFFCENITFSLKGKKQFAKTQIKNLIEMENKKVGELCFIFCNDDFLLDINNKHLNHNYYTDVITFDYSVDNIISGDIFISLERIKENAEKFDVSFAHELSRVIYHGLLHLCDYKDKSDDEKRTMREKEDFYIKTLEIIMK
jgi:rRNA maturation RNase YbeY